MGRNWPSSMINFPRSPHGARDIKDAEERTKEATKCSPHGARDIKDAEEGTKEATRCSPHGARDIKYAEEGTKEATRCSSHGARDIKDAEEGRRVWGPRKQQRERGGTEEKVRLRDV